ncbi:hypothetical protein [Synechococcus sp. PCC 7336]|uniref:hypothetical protein n=1 Tax=Synechococcus sp. PCC 7336 TaxID=195250 RepID=UPI0003471B95|nr:hypothetical protein [Synechococcus sp. PCC 7336]
MPPRWKVTPSRRESEYRYLDDRYTLAANAMLYSTVVTGLWFFQLLYRADWPWLQPVAIAWTAILALNALWVMLVARYPGLTEKTGSDLVSKEELSSQEEG